jgi:hypothetical protein
VNGNSDQPRLRVTIGLEWLDGYKEIELTWEQALRYYENPNEVICEALGCRLATYFEWLARRGRPQCIGKTKRGMRCKGALFTVLLETPADYEKFEGGYCWSHEEGANSNV